MCRKRQLSTLYSQHSTQMKRMSHSLLLGFQVQRSRVARAVEEVERIQIQPAAARRRDRPRGGRTGGKIPPIQLHIRHVQLIPQRQQREEPAAASARNNAALVLHGIIRPVRRRPQRAKGEDIRKYQQINKQFLHIICILAARDRHYYDTYKSVLSIAYIEFYPRL